MTKIKRLVAVALAFLMIFGSITVTASAWDAATDDGFDLNIKTKIFRQVNGTWTETEKVKRGESVKARVYLNTTYFANAGELLFFYNNDFFEDAYTSSIQPLAVNSYYQASPYSISGQFYGSKSASKGNVYKIVVKGYGNIAVSVIRSPIRHADGAYNRLVIL